MKKLAIVEDNPDNLLLIQAILGSSYEYIIFENGMDALEGLPKTEVDLLLLDIALPGLDGVTLLQKLRDLKAFESIPAMALTANAMLGDKENYLALGFNAYYSKPILNLEEFRDLVASMIK